MIETKPPSKLLWAMEVPRGAFGLAQFFWGRRMLARGPKGDGRPILILPGLVNADLSNFAMRGYLNRLGYRAYGWGLGRNFGARAIGPEGEKLFARIREIHGETGETVTLIGVSLGGIMARLAAHRVPELVREVITVSSPFAGSPRATNVWRAFEWLSGEKVDDPKVMAMAKEIAAPLPVPTAAIWSASDGLVNGAICQEPGSRNIRVRSSHMGVQVRPEVLLAIAKLLAGEA
jgi:pimeloyl-ACP methyl ester carboxylesterase